MRFIKLNSHISVNDMLISPSSCKTKIGCLAIKLFPFFLLCLFTTSCLRPIFIKENLARGQIVETTVIRKISNEKKWGFVKKYDEYFEGYLLGGLVDSNGRPIQGVIVSIKDREGKEDPHFIKGVTNNSGMFKIRFSLPIDWNRVEYIGTFSSESHWKIVAPESQFKIYFNRKNGVLAYFPSHIWLPAKSDAVQKKLESDKIKKMKQNTPVKKPKPKSDDLFGDFGFE